MNGAPPLSVLYEDNHLLVVEKPVNVPVQADVSGDDDLLTICKRYIKEKYEKPGEVYLGLVHRLDRPVGGVMVFARTSKAAARLTSQFAAHTARKRYAAIVCGAPLSEASLTDWLRKDETTHSSAVVQKESPGAKEARLRYALLGRAESAGETALLDVRLDTGRPHQIRVQLSHAGLPILGDQRYNPDAKPGAQICLWAYALSIEHPTLGEPMTFFSKPQGRAWEAFPAQIAMLPAFSVCRGVFLSDELLVCDKNAGVEVEEELLTELRSLFSDELYPLHRLDANTVGLVAFARTEAAEKRFLSAFREHDLTKIYHAVNVGVPSPREGTLEHYLQKDAAGAFIHVCEKDASGALCAKLRYRTLADDGQTALVEIELLTGRTHQIRVQLAAAGCPVLGDDKYGDRAANKRFRCRVQQLLAKRLMLDGKTFESCRELTFPPRGADAPEAQA